MQSEAFRYEKSFGHSSKPSKQQFHTVVNDFHVNKNDIFQKVPKHNLTGVKLRKTMR